MSRIGLRIIEKEADELAPSIYDGFRAVGVAQASDCMGRLYGSADLVAVHESSQRMVGRALTVKSRPGDNLLIHRAIAMSGPGDVIVVDAGGCLAHAVIGELMMLQARRQGVCGFVVDGAVRDAEAFGREDFPCFARGLSHRGPYKDGPGEINVPVSVGGLVVQPGDVVLGDRDGVLAVPAAYAPTVLEAALQKEASETGAMQRIAAGTHQKPWLAQGIEALRGDYA